VAARPGDILSPHQVRFRRAIVTEVNDPLRATETFGPLSPCFSLETIDLAKKEAALPRMLAVSARPARLRPATASTCWRLPRAVARTLESVYTAGAVHAGVAL